jgi:hypothetical protein
MFIMVLYNLLSPENKSKMILKENCPWIRRELLSACSTKTVPQGTLLMGATFLLSTPTLEVPFPVLPFSSLFLSFFFSLSLGAHFLPAKEAYVRYVLMNYSEHRSVHCWPTTPILSDAVFNKPYRCSEMFWNIMHPFTCLSWELRT